MGTSSRVCRRDRGRGSAVAIVVRSVHGRTACRGHQPHHDHHGGTGGRTGGRLIATIAANERNSSPFWPPSSGATTPPRPLSTGGSARAVSSGRSGSRLGGGRSGWTAACKASRANTGRTTEHGTNHVSGFGRVRRATLIGERCGRVRATRRVERSRSSVWSPVGIASHPGARGGRPGGAVRGGGSRAPRARPAPRQWPQPAHFEYRPIHHGIERSDVGGSVQAAGQPRVLGGELGRQRRAVCPVGTAASRLRCRISTAADAPMTAISAPRPGVDRGGVRRPRGRVTPARAPPAPGRTAPAVAGPRPAGRGGRRLSVISAADSGRRSQSTKRDHAGLGHQAYPGPLLGRHGGRHGGELGQHLHHRATA